MTQPLTGYGTDTWCTDTLRTGVLVRGPVLVAQALFGRLISRRGTLRGGDSESTYGFDAAGYIGAVGAPQALLALPSLVEGELKKDERVGAIFVTATEAENSDGTLSITIAIGVTLADASGAFTLTLSVNDVSASIVGLDVA